MEDGNFSFLEENSNKMYLEDAWKAFSSSDGNYKTFVNNLEQLSWHSGGSTREFFQMMKIAKKSWKDFLNEYILQDGSFYCSFSDDEKDIVRQILEKY